MTFTQKIDLAKKCEILLIGNELLIGKTRDFNGFWLGKQISPFGISITRITTIRDDIKEIGTILNEILSRKPDYLITSGGLGPTFDDETIKGIANGLNKKLILDDTAFSWIKERYELGHKMGWIKDPTINEARKKMAYIPEGSKPLSNSMGAAPGVLIEIDSIKIFILPGVPREMQAIYNEIIAPILHEENKDIIFHQFGFDVYGVGESTMAKKILDLMNEIDDRIWIKSHARRDKSGKGYVAMHITGYGNMDFGKEVNKVADKVKQIIISLKGKIKMEKKKI